MRISDWSSDVCSSDLPAERLLQWTDHHAQGIYVRLGDHDPDDGSKPDTPVRTPFTLAFSANQAVGQMQQSSSPRRPYGVCRLLDNDHAPPDYCFAFWAGGRIAHPQTPASLLMAIFPRSS